ncbi:MAG: hypothetical protein PUJ07_00020 [Eubacteriales bacterium]|nr:hypothetical protein [Eubacteriales bacterium]
MCNLLTASALVVSTLKFAPVQYPLNLTLPITISSPVAESAFVPSKLNVYLFQFTKRLIFAAGVIS